MRPPLTAVSVHTHAAMPKILRKIGMYLAATLLVWCSPLFARENADSVRHRQHFSLELLQIKESLNFGLVFAGPLVGYGHSWEHESEQAYSLFTSQLGAGVVFSRGIVGANIHLKPAEWRYQWKISPDFSIGTLLAAEYNYQLYPDLQSGFSYWFSHWSAGLAMGYRFQALNTGWQVRGTTSLLGFTSRPTPNRDPYFFDLGFVEAVRYLHQNIQFGSLNRFNRTSLELRWQPDDNIYGVRISYTLDVDAYFDAPRLITLHHGIKIFF